MNSTYEFGIYLTHFCNVDLFRQGLYFFRIGLYNKIEDNDLDNNNNNNSKDKDKDNDNNESINNKHFALPYRTMMGKQHERDFLVRSEDRQTSSGHIDDITSSYCSSVFRVQYQEQKVRLNEGCLFRLDLPYQPKQRVYIDIELVFCELHASDYKTKGFPTFEEFTIVDKTTLCMEDCYHGIHSIYPVSFSTSHFCLVNCMVHGELINFKFIPPPPQHKLIAKYVKLNTEINGKNISDMNHHYNNQHVILAQQTENKDNKTIDISKVKNGSNIKDKPISISNNNMDDLQEPIPGISSFAEVLFYDRVDCILTENDWNNASEHHLFYVACLLHTYEKLQKYVHQYVERYLDDANIPNLQNEFDQLYPVPDIELDQFFSTPYTLKKKSNDTESKEDNNNDSKPNPISTSILPPTQHINTSNNKHSAPILPSYVNGLANLDITNSPKSTAWKYNKRIISIKDRFSPSEKREMTGRKICHIIGEDVHKIAGQVFRVWHFFLSIIPFCKRLLTKKLLYEWEKSFVERWGACIFRETLTVRARLRVVSTSLSEHEMISRKVRSQSTLNQLEPPPLQDIIYMIDPKQQAVIFEQTYNLPDNRSSESIRLLDQINNNNDPSQRASTLLSKLSGKNRKKISTYSTSQKKKLKEKFQRNKNKDKDKDKEQDTNSTSPESSSSMSVKPNKSKSNKSKRKSTKKLFLFRSRSASIKSKKRKDKGKGKDKDKKKDNKDKEEEEEEEKKIEKNDDRYRSASGILQNDKHKLNGNNNGNVRRMKSLDDNDVIPPMVDSLHINKNDDKTKSNINELNGHQSSTSMSSISPVNEDSEDKDVNNNNNSKRKPPLIVRTPPTSVVSVSNDEEEEQKENDDNNLDDLSDELLEDNLKKKKISSPPKDVKKILSDDNIHNKSGSKKKRKKKRKKKKKALLDDECEDMNLETDHDCIGKHLFVLVHGYQGNSWDMRMFRNHLLVKCPNDLFLMSESNENEGQTEGDITEMGERLANEIVEFIDLNITSQRNKLCRLSFITHSLGGIIAREALTNKVLKPYLSQCYTFISLAVCHCGYLFGRSKALQAGFWVMRSWKKSLCLSQLSLTDNENPRKTYMYKLSQKQSLSYFKNVLLVSSPEDRYTPYHSTRIEMHRKTVQDTKWGRIYNEMVRNLLRPLDNVNLTRFDVSFVNRKINLDSMIGRSAHICFLEQPLYIDMLIHVYKKYFVST